MCSASMLTNTGYMTLTDRINTLDSLKSENLSQGLAGVPAGFKVLAYLIASKGFHSVGLRLLFGEGLVSN